MSKVNSRMVCDFAIYLCLMGAVVVNVYSLGAEEAVNAAIQTCDEDLYDDTTHGCCSGTVYNLETQGCCNGTVYDLFTKGCCNDTVFDSTQYCCCHSACDGSGTVSLLPIAECTQDP